MLMIYILIPISMILLILAYLFFKWAVKTEQYEDLQMPAHQIIYDDKAEKQVIKDE